MIRRSRVAVGKLSNSKSLRSRLGETTADCARILEN